MSNKKKCGLVLEGGGMRGLFTAGVMDELMENSISFDGAIGVSSGAIFGCNYKSHQPGRALRYNIRFMDDPRYMGFMSFIKTGDWVGADFAYHRMAMELDPMDLETYNNSPMEFHVVCSDINTGEAVYRNLSFLDDKEIDWIRASASLPFVSNPVQMGGRSLLDGGMTDSIPLEYFQRIGYTKNVVVLTQPLQYEKRPLKAMPLFRLLLRKQPMVARLLEKRYIMYNNELRYISEQEAKGNVLLISPQKKLPIGRIEQNEKKFLEIYQMGRYAAKSKMDDIMAFLTDNYADRSPHAAIVGG